MEMVGAPLKYFSASTPEGWVQKPKSKGIATTTMYAPVDAGRREDGDKGKRADIVVELPSGEVAIIEFKRVRHNVISFPSRGVAFVDLWFAKSELQLLQRR